MIADLPQICRFEGVEEIWSKKPAWGAQMTENYWKEEVAGGSTEKCQRRLLEATKNGYDTILNILLNILQRVEEGQREERERKHRMNYIVLSMIIIVNTDVSIYRETNNLVD